MEDMLIGMTDVAYEQDVSIEILSVVLGKALSQGLRSGSIDSPSANFLKFALQTDHTRPGAGLTAN